METVAPDFLLALSAVPTHPTSFLSSFCRLRLRFGLHRVSSPRTFFFLSGRKSPLLRIQVIFLSRLVLPSALSLPSALLLRSCIIHHSEYSPTLFLSLLCYLLPLCTPSIYFTTRRLLLLTYPSSIHFMIPLTLYFTFIFMPSTLLPSPFASLLHASPFAVLTLCFTFISKQHDLFVSRTCRNRTSDFSHPTPDSSIHVITSSHPGFRSSI